MRKNQGPKLAPSLFANFSGKLNKRLVMLALTCGARGINISRPGSGGSNRKNNWQNYDYLSIGLDSL